MSSAAASAFQSAAGAGRLAGQPWGPPERLTDSQPPTRPSYTCQQCGRAFAKPAKLAEHMFSHSDARSFVCTHPGCVASYKRNDHLLRHITRTHGSSTVTSSGETWPSDQKKKDVFDPARPYVCTHLVHVGSTADSEECGRRFWTQHLLERHLEGVHNVEGLGRRKSQAGGEGASPANVAESSSAANTDGGGVRRTLAYTCTEPGCSDSFAKRKQLRAHIWDAHSLAPSAAAAALGEKPPLPFPCAVAGCAKSFATNAKRRAHAKTHDAQRYSCFLPHAPHDASSRGADDDADVAASSSSLPSSGPLFFPTWTALQRHVKEAHPPTCPHVQCAKVFGSHKELRSHLQHHHRGRATRKAKERRPSGAEKNSARLSDEEEEDDDDDDDDDDEFEVQLASDSATEEDVGRAPRRRTFACTWPPSGVDEAQCPKIFLSAYARDTHVRSAHLGLRPYACPNRGCERRYAYKQLLRRHARVCRFPQRGSAASGGAEGAQQLGARGESWNGAEESEGDEYFLREGGAVPEADSERGRTQNAARRKRVRRTDEGSSEEEEEGNPSEAAAKRRRRGRGLDGALTTLLSAAAGAAAATVRRGRRSRGKVLSCPWQRICELAEETEVGKGTAVDGDDDAPDGRRGRDDDTTEGEGEERGRARLGGDVTARCDFRFSRLYDLRRHMRAVHALELDEAELRALVPAHEARALTPMPRRPSSEATAA